MKAKALTVISALSLLLCIGFAALWVRSYVDGEAWLLTPRTIPQGIPYRLPPDYQLSTNWLNQRSITSAKGYLQLREDHYVSARRYGVPEKRGYQRDQHIYPPNRRPLGHATPGERHWSIPGIAVASRPAWSDGNGTMVSGTRSVTVAWWLPFILSAILPAVWLRSEWRRRLRERRRKRKLCAECGYDLRIGHDQCPECGAAVVGATIRQG